VPFWHVCPLEQHVSPQHVNPLKQQVPPQIGVPAEQQIGTPPKGEVAHVVVLSVQQIADDPVPHRHPPAHGLEHVVHAPFTHVWPLVQQLLPHGDAPFRHAAAAPRQVPVDALAHAIPA
jgi:hypothetical protein